MQVGGEGEHQRTSTALARYHLWEGVPNERLDRITLLTAQIFGVPTAVITLIDEHRQWHASRVGLRVKETDRDVAFCNRAVQGDDVLVVTDAERDPLFAQHPQVDGPLGLRFYAGAPLRTPDGHNIGTLAVVAYEPRTFEPWERRVLVELAAFVMSELELCRCLHELSEQQETLVADLTRRYRLERELSERRFQALVRHTPDVMLLFGRDGTVCFANATCERVLGYAPDELFGVDAIALLLEGEAARVEVRAWLGAIAAEPGALASRHLRLRHRSGRQIEVWATVQNLFDEPSVSAFALHARDIGAETAARRELEHARNQLRLAERMEAVGRLAGGIAHDFNNLLTVVINSAEFARRKIPANSSAQRDLEQILVASERGAALSRQILAFSRNRLASTEVVHPDDLIGDMLDLLRRAVGEQIQLEFVAGRDLPPLQVDRGQLEQVLLHLCLNAKDAIAGAGNIVLTTSVVQIGPEIAARHPWVEPGPYVQITVRDSGRGMSPQVLEHAFEPFFTTKPLGQGTGLGLATTYGTVRQHEGFVEIRTELGRGTEVRLFLPAQMSAPDASTGAHGGDVERGERPPSRGHGAVLVAEDDELVRELAQSALTEAGYQVYVARDGAEAVARFAERAHEVRLVVVDSVMPRLGGLDAVQRMRSLRPDLSYLIVSGYDLDAEHLPAGRWFAKPYRAEDLVRRVQSMLGD